LIPDTGGIKGETHEVQLQQAQSQGKEKQSDIEPANTQAHCAMHRLLPFIHMFRKYYRGWFAPEFNHQGLKAFNGPIQPDRLRNGWKKEKRVWERDAIYSRRNR
jgi:hypothetical protein